MTLSSQITTRFRNISTTCKQNKYGSEKRKYIVNLQPINQALVSRIIEDNGYDVFMTKSPEEDFNFQISKLDLKNIPKWLSERFDSILSILTQVILNHSVKNSQECF